MRTKSEIEAQIAQLQAELAEIEKDGFRPLSELARELQPGDLIEMRVDEVDKNHNCPVRAGKEWFMRDTLARKSRPAEPALQWITAAEAAQMPDIVGKLVVVEMVVKNIDPHTDCYCPLTALEPHTQDEISFIYKSKLAVLDDEI